MFTFDAVATEKRLDLEEKKGGHLVFWCGRYERSWELIQHAENGISRCWRSFLTNHGIRRILAILDRFCQALHGEQLHLETACRGRTTCTQPKKKFTKHSVDVMNDE